MVELTNTDVHQNAMVIVLVHAFFAFVAVPHSDPFLNIALHALLDVLGCIRHHAMVRVAARVVFENQVVADQREAEFERSEGVADDEGEDYGEVDHKNRVFGIYHTD